MGLEETAGAHVAPPPATQTPTLVQPLPASAGEPKRPGRPPLAPEARANKAMRETLRRMAAGALDAKSEEEFIAKLERARQERESVRTGKPPPAPAVAGQVYTAKEKTPAELEAAKREATLAKFGAARAELAALLTAVEQTVGAPPGTLVSPERAALATMAAAPWYANNPLGTEVSSKAQRIGLAVGVAILIGPAVVRAAKAYAPKVADWWKARQAARKPAEAPAQP